MTKLHQTERLSLSPASLAALVRGRKAPEAGLAGPAPGGGKASTLTPSPRANASPPASPKLGSSPPPRRSLSSVGRRFSFGGRTEPTSPKPAARPSPSTPPASPSNRFAALHGPWFSSLRQPPSPPLAVRPLPGEGPPAEPLAPRAPPPSPAASARQLSQGPAYVARVSATTIAGARRLQAAAAVDQLPSSTDPVHYLRSKAGVTAGVFYVTDSFGRTDTCIKLLYDAQREVLALHLAQHMGFVCPPMRFYGPKAAYFVHTLAALKAQVAPLGSGAIDPTASTLAIVEMGRLNATSLFEMTGEAVSQALDPSKNRHAVPVFEEVGRMVAFDLLIGNNDRFYLKEPFACRLNTGNVLLDAQFLRLYMIDPTIGDTPTDPMQTERTVKKLVKQHPKNCSLVRDVLTAFFEPSSAASTGDGPVTQSQLTSLFSPPVWEAVYRGVLEGIVLAAGCLTTREIEQFAENASCFGEMDNPCRSPYDVRVRAIIAQQQVFVRHAPAIVDRLDRLRGPL